MEQNANGDSNALMLVLSGHTSDSNALTLHQSTILKMIYPLRKRAFKRKVLLAEHVTQSVRLHRSGNKVHPGV